MSAFHPPKTWKDWLALFLSLVSICLVGAHIMYLPLNDDAGYFIPLARTMLDGQLPYLDVFNWHTPLGPVFLMPLARLGPDTLIWVAPLFMTAWNLLSASLIMWKVNASQQHPYSSLLAGSFFLAMAILTDGYYVTLEPIYLPMMLGAWILLDRKEVSARQVFIAGLLLGLAVMVKQFAMIGLVALIPLVDVRSAWRSFLPGLSVVPVLTLLFFWAHGLRPDHLMSFWLAPSGTGQYLDSWIDWSGGLLIAFPLLIWGVGHRWPVGMWIPLVVGLAGWLALWVVGGNWQYWLPLAGWLVMGMPGRKRTYSLPAQVIAPLVVVGVSLLYVISTLPRREAQLNQARVVSQEVHDDSFLIMGNARQYLYALSDCQPPMLWEAGFQIYPMLEPGVRQQVLDSADVVLVFPSFYEEFNRHKEAFQELGLFPAERTGCYRRIRNVEDTHP